MAYFEAPDESLERVARGLPADEAIDLFEYMSYSLPREERLSVEPYRSSLSALAVHMSPETAGALLIQFVKRYVSEGNPSSAQFAAVLAVLVQRAPPTDIAAVCDDLATQAESLMEGPHFRIERWVQAVAQLPVDLQDDRGSRLLTRLIGLQGSSRPASQALRVVAKKMGAARAEVPIKAALGSATNPDAIGSLLSR